MPAAPHRQCRPPRPVTAAASALGLAALLLSACEMSPPAGPDNPPATQPAASATANGVASDTPSDPPLDPTPADRAAATLAYWQALADVFQHVQQRAALEPGTTLAESARFASDAAAVYADAAAAVRTLDGRIVDPDALTVGVQSAVYLERSGSALDQYARSLEQVLALPADANDAQRQAGRSRILAARDALQEAHELGGRLAQDARRIQTILSVRHDQPFPPLDAVAATQAR
jgi:hypothetical protein